MTGILPAADRKSEATDMEWICVAIVLGLFAVSFGMVRLLDRL
jgi:hypothetical protein